MTEIKVKDELHHLILRLEDIKPGRIDICPSYHFIQCAGLNMQRGKTFKAHKHIWKDAPSWSIAQESWCVIKGSVKVFFYDCDFNLLHTDVLLPGDASYTFLGGHNYEILEDDTIVYEYKTGPYLGQQNDKQFII